MNVKTWYVKQPLWVQASIAIASTTATIFAVYRLTKKKAPKSLTAVKKGFGSAKTTYAVDKLAFIEKVKDNREAFGKKVIEVSAKLDTLPNNLMIVMNNESGLNPKAKNPTSSATGLIQFMKDTAIGLGTTVEAISKMSNVQQMDYVYKYLVRYKDKFKDVSDLYLAVFYPLALYQKESWMFPEWAVKANKIFDINKDGKLSKAEFRQYVNQKYAKYL